MKRKSDHLVGVVAVASPIAEIPNAKGPSVPNAPSSVPQEKRRKVAHIKHKEGDDDDDEENDGSVEALNPKKALFREAIKAISTDDVGNLTRLLKRGLSPNGLLALDAGDDDVYCVVESKKSLVLHDDSLLEECIEKRAEACLELLLNEGANRYTRDCDWNRYNLAHRCVSESHDARARRAGVRLLKLLLTVKISVAKRNVLMDTDSRKTGALLETAACRGNVEVVSYLLTTFKHKYNAGRELDSVLNSCARERHDHERKAQCALMVVQAGADVNLRSKDSYRKGDTVLHMAAQAGNAYLVRALLKSGANPNAVNEAQLETPLHVAVRSHNANLDVIALLVAFGADASLKNKDNAIPAEMAASNASASYLSHYPNLPKAALEKAVLNKAYGKPLSEEVGGFQPYSPAV